MTVMCIAVLLALGADPQGVIRVQSGQLRDVAPQPEGVVAPRAYPGQPIVVRQDMHPPAVPYQYAPPSDPQENDGLFRGFAKYCCAWFKPMPQTCYSPHFGCYPGNGRDIHRYPAFHGYYYRQAYNYRPLFEYPWQAGLHEPLPLELNSERSLLGRPINTEQRPAETIRTPVTNPPHSVP